MKKLYLLTTVIHVLAFFAAAQRPDKQTEGWRIARPVYDAFQVESPADLKNSGGKDSDDSRKYWTQVNNTYVYAFSDPIKEPRHNEVVLRFAGSLEQKGSKTDFQGFPATTFTFEDEDGFRHRILIVKTYSRLFSFHVVSPKEQILLADRFFDSIKVFLGPEPLPSSEEIAASKDAPSPIGPARSGSGSGSGNGPDRLEKPTVVPPPTANSSSPVRILSSPKALYTNFARFYEVNGSALVKVNFLADGTIGTVTPVTRLPFGLTGRAIAAAKLIRFNPAVRNGVPYQVIKTFEYTFSIY